MGVVIEIKAYGTWACTYFVQSFNKRYALKKAYEKAKATFSCDLPNSLEEAEINENISIALISYIDEVIGDEENVD